MSSKLTLNDEYEVRALEGSKLGIKYEKYLFYSNKINYKIFVENSKVEILKEIENPVYQKLSEEESKALLIAIENALKKLEETSTIEFTGAPLGSKSLTIINFEEDDEVSSEAGKKLLRYKEERDD